MKPPKAREPGEEMNVRKVHGALWRETAEPSEQWKRVPWLLKHSFLMLVIFAIIYLLTQVYNWNEYEVDPVLRFHRDRQIRMQESPPPTPNPVRP